jgi:hypothetical protein
MWRLVSVTQLLLARPWYGKGMQRIPRSHAFIKSCLLKWRFIAFASCILISMSLAFLFVPVPTVADSATQRVGRSCQEGWTCPDECSVRCEVVKVQAITTADAGALWCLQSTRNADF